MDDSNSATDASRVESTPKGTTEAPPTPALPKVRRGGCGCMLPVLMIIALIGFAPQIITMTSLRNQVPALLMAELPPGVEIGSASVGWVSPLQLNDVVIPDDQGRPSLKVKHVTLSRSLWDLAKSTEDLGKLDIEQPELQVYLDRGVSNYDKFLKRLAGKPKGGKRSLFDLKLTGGLITVRNETRVVDDGSAPMPDSNDPARDGSVIPTTGGVGTGDADPAADVTTDMEAAAPVPPTLNGLAEDSSVVESEVQNDSSEPLPDSTPKRPAKSIPASKAAPQIIEGALLAIIDIEKGILKSQASGEEELVAELTAKLREPVVESPLTAEFRWNLPEGTEAGIGSGKMKCDIPSLPLAVLSPWISPLVSGRDIGGDVAINAAAEIVPSEKNLLLASQISLSHLDLQLGPGDAASPPFRWVGDDLKLVVEGQGDLGGELLEIESVQLRTPVLNADFSGTVRDLPGPMVCRLEGKCDLNPADLVRTLPAEWAERVKFEGLQLGQIRVEGPLRRIADQNEVVSDEHEGQAAAPPGTPLQGNAPLRVIADVQWASADVMGFHSQDALVNVDWSENQLAINPNRLPVGQGRWVASPRIEFTPAGRYLVFDGGKIFENVDFTQEMSHTWLRYVSPILGSATSIEGRFSLSASPARVAMFAPYEGDFEGEIDIHSAQVGPGALTKQIIEAIAGIQTIMGQETIDTQQWLMVNEQKVPFAFAEGRVYHKNLRVGFGEVVVESQGSVGLDETIDFLVTIPIPEKWTEGKPLLATLKGEKVPFQMGGTLDHPQLDGRALGDFGKRIGFKSAGGLLQQLIERRLEKKANGELPAKPPRVRPKRKKPSSP